MTSQDALALVQQEADVNARLIAKGRWLLPQLRDAGHVDGLPVPPPGRHTLRAPICIDGRTFVQCGCGWTVETFHQSFHHSRLICGVGEAESEYQIALWCAEKRIAAAKARGERDATALQQAMAAERR